MKRGGVRGIRTIAVALIPKFEELGVTYAVISSINFIFRVQ